MHGSSQPKGLSDLMWGPGFPGYTTQNLKWRGAGLGARSPGFFAVSSASFLGHLVHIVLSPNPEPVSPAVNCWVGRDGSGSSVASRFPLVQAGGDVSTMVDLLFRFVVCHEAPSCYIHTVGSRASLEFEKGIRQWWQQLGSLNGWC